MKTLILLAIAFLFLADTALSQVYTMNWGTSISPAWVTGNTSGIGNNVNGSGIRVTIGMVKTGGVFTTTLGSYGGPNTPTVSSSTFIVGGSSSNIQLSLDYGSSAEYTDITVTFSSPVLNARFNIADIDRLINNSNTYLDKVTVTGYHYGSAIPATLSKYDAVTDPNFLIISGNTANVNPANGFAGNTASDATDQKGTVKVSFKGYWLTSLVIRYGNAAGTVADPTVQNISIGNITFRTATPVPVELISFQGAHDKTGSNTLTWETALEKDFDHFSIERSEDGKEFNEIGNVEGQHSVTSQVVAYSFSDKDPSPVSYYRLKMIDVDGSYEYSKIISIRGASATWKVFPTVFSSQVNVLFNATQSGTTPVEVVSLSGARVYYSEFATHSGANELHIQLPASLPKGQYLIHAGQGRQSAMIQRQ
jgi:hypothetical protein